MRINIYDSYIGEKSYDQLIDELNVSEMIEFPEFGLSDLQDQIVILNNMKEDRISLRDIPSLRSLFHHVDNVRYIYHSYGKEVPVWYREKYQHLFAR